MTLRIALPLLLAIALVPAAAAAEPLRMRIWQLHDMDAAYIGRVIDLAPSYGITGIQLSHNIVMEAERLLDNRDFAREIDGFAQRAHERGLEATFWTHELSGVPKKFFVDGKVDFDRPEFRAHLRDKYHRVFDLCPNLDGTVLTFHETAQPVYDDSRVKSALPRAQRVAVLIDTLAQACADKGKQLVVRSFAHQPDELAAIQEGFALAQSDFTVMTKCQPHDWQPYYPHNPLIGAVGGRPQIVEFDLGDEFFGECRVPYAQVGYLKWRLDYAVPRGIVGGVARLERLRSHALDTPNWANVYAWSKLMQDPTLDPHGLVLDWAIERFGEQPAPLVASAMERTFAIVNKTLLALEFWVTDHSRFTSYGYAFGHIDSRNTAKWDPSLHNIETHDALRHPTPETLAKLEAEKAGARALWEQSWADLNQARKHGLRDEDFGWLKTYFQRESVMIDLWTAWSRVLFGLRRYEQIADPAQGAQVRTDLARLRELVAAHEDDLRALHQQGDGNVRAARDFMNDVERRLAQVKDKGN
jgi:hypothetical protein